MATFRADIADQQLRRDAKRQARAQRGRMGRWLYGPRRSWLLIILLGLCILGLVTLLGGRAYLYKDMPSLPDKAAMWELNLAPNVTLLDANGARLGHRGPDIGQPRTLSELPRHVPDAVLAIEDERFFEHEGVDREAILRAFVNNLREGERGQGGSTLTQQLVKTMVLSPEKTYRRKFQEAVLSIRMEEVLTKPEILELYINRTTMGVQLFGIEAAAQTYFGKPATELTLSEAALLAAIPKAPSRLDPRENFDGAWTRAGLVLDRMVANAMITPTEATTARTTPPVMVAATETPVPEAILGYAFDYAVERAKQLTGEAVPDLIITTSLDSTNMVSAHTALTKTLDKYGESKKVTEGAIISIDNQSGAIMTMIGGRDYSDTKFNRSTQAERQPGSAFKPFVYAAALEDGFTPGTVRIDQPLTIDKWKPENYTKRYKGPMTLREALKLSINTVAAQVGAEVGPSRVAEIARRFGIDDTQMREHFSLALGSSEVTLIDMTGAFTVFANEGLRREPYLVSRVTDSSGRTLYQRRDRSAERVYDPGFARQLTSMLHDVIESGTAYAAKFGGRKLAGKTGTSQDYRDAWFIGFSNQITTGVWMGNDDNSQMKEVTGGLLPVDVWKATMRAAHKDLPKKALSEPNLNALSAYRRQMVTFYTDLSDQFEKERDTAAGITQ